MSRPYFVTADCYLGNAPTEGFDLNKSFGNLVVASTNTDFRRFVSDLTDKGNYWLPAAAEKLNISPSLKDYVITPTVSMPSDLPNRNGMAFPLEELTAWMPDLGMPMYRSWVGMPSFVEHNNSDYTKAKGIILDSRMMPIKGSAGNIWKVVKLVAWDRTRDPVLANDILTGKRRCYSMGANAADFSCSVCGNHMSNGCCEHVLPPNKPLREYKEYAGVLAYNNVLNPKGFEISSVETPAYISASGTNPINWY